MIIYSSSRKHRWSFRKSKYVYSSADNQHRVPYYYFDED